MKIRSRINTSEAEDGSFVQSPVRVCMCVLGKARTDVRVMREAKTLKEAGFGVSIVDIETEQIHPSEEDIDGICVKHIIAPSWYTPTHLKLWFLVKVAQVLIRSTIRLIGTSADIYHAHEELALPACYVAAKVHRKPLIFDAHELPISEPYITRWHKLSRVARHLLEIFLSRCSRVITVSPPIAQKLRRYYKDSEVLLIRNVPMYRTVTKNDRLRQRLGLSSDTRVALYQGNLQQDRGLDQLIRASAFLEPDVVIVMMGKGLKEMVNQLEAMIANEKVTDRVRIIPPVPYEELLDWTASADIGLIVYSPGYSMNVQMCLPNKLFEYIMAGLPVLSSSLDVVAEILNTYDIGQVVTSLAPKDIAAAINSMLANHDALVRMHRNALEVAQREFCWEKERQQLICLYQDIFPK